ncbi:MAG: metallophosphoesterase [Nitrososphaera sp.]|nr:metallophosphoesterase [Nitrososphaera sp.]
MTSHLIIPDTHAHCDYSNARFKWLGEFIADIKPDHVIMMGDWADMPSLCTYDYGTKGYEGRRYVKDIEAGIEAQELMFQPIRDRKKKLPKFWLLEGNHEHRITKAVSSDAKLEGVLSLSDLQYREFGWEVVPYYGSTPGVLHLDGIAYAHYHVSGVMARPIGGVHPAYSLIQKYGHSATQGHIHTLDYHHRSNAMGDLHGLVCGVYQDWNADFAGVANAMWWRGVILKTDVAKGSYDLHTYRIEHLKRVYAKN